MAKNPTFTALIKRMEEIHDRKNNDYAKDSDPYSNFRFAAEVAGCSVDTVFRVLIGVKLARIAELTASGKEPKNEAIEDSFLDLATYSAIWASYHAAK